MSTLEEDISHNVMYGLETNISGSSIKFKADEYRELKQEVSNIILKTIIQRVKQLGETNENS